VYIQEQSELSKTLFPEIEKYTGVAVGSLKQAKGIHSIIECDIEAGHRNPLPPDLFTETEKVKDFYMFYTEGFSE
jgi:hypothetical protein